MRIMLLKIKVIVIKNKGFIRIINLSYKKINKNKFKDFLIMLVVQRIMEIIRII
jgi:hypothetical protein